VFIGHVGDSRGYLVRDGQVKQLTRDHSLVQELLDNGSITQDQVKNHPNKNIITRALGTEDDVDVDCYEVTLKNNDILILCTDGLTHHVNLCENSDLFTSGISMAEIASILGHKALEGGGTDNITVVVTQYFDRAEER
jgi:protein phosphatase